MSFYEFKLKSFAYHRERDYNTEIKMIIGRKIALASWWGGQGNVKQFPKRETDIFETSFDKKNNQVIVISEETRKAFTKETLDWLKVARPEKYKEIMSKHIN